MVPPPLSAILCNTRLHVITHCLTTIRHVITSGGTLWSPVLILGFYIFTHTHTHAYASQILIKRSGPRIEPWGTPISTNGYTKNLFPIPRIIPHNSCCNCIKTLGIKLGYQKVMRHTVKSFLKDLSVGFPKDVILIVNQLPCLFKW